MNIVEGARSQNFAKPSRTNHTEFYINTQVFGGWIQQTALLAWQHKEVALGFLGFSS